MEDKNLPLTLILGGARSGKSSYAEQRAAAHPGPVTYIATAQALDDEMRQRIAAHQQRRPAHWRTFELPFEVAASLPPQPPDGLVLLDCLTLLVSNLILRACSDLDHPDQAIAQAALEVELGALEAAMRASSAAWLVVSNEVGLGLVPPYPVGRLYRDLLGWANQRLARQSSEVIFMLAGLPMRFTPQV